MNLEPLLSVFIFWITVTPFNIAHKMPVAKLILEIEIPHAQSLKDRRQVIRSLKDKLRHAFNLSIAELDDGIVWNRATLGIAAISSSTSYLTGQLEQIDQAAHRIATTLSAEITRLLRRNPPRIALTHPLSTSITAE